MAKALTTAFVVAGVILAALFFLIHKPSMAEVDPVSASSFAADEIARGEVLAGIGNCATCHTSREGRPYAGGRDFSTGFGTLYSTNITPDPEEGIGRWSRDAFARAMHKGIARNGTYLYPAFPYTHFKNLADEDLDALYAYLMSLEPIAYTPPENAMRFPFNLRFLQWGWQLLFFDDEPLRPDPQQSDAWNRGAYLAEGAGHCTACHSPRNAFGAENKDRAYAGALVDNWYAPALNAQQPVPVHWDADSLYSYLRDGQADYQGVAVGSMGEVVHNGLRKAPDRDIRALAVYLASVAGPTDANAATQRGRELMEAAQQRSESAHSHGEYLYLTACAGCHFNAAGAPLALRAELSLNSAVTASDPTNLLRVLLQGVSASEGTPGIVMPAFAVLTDEDIGSLAEFLRQRAGLPAWQGLDKRLGELRGQLAEKNQSQQGGSQ